MAAGRRGVAGEGLIEGADDDLGAHVHTDVEGGPTEDDRFEKASALCGAEFSNALEYIVACELPARAIVEAALRGRHGVQGDWRAD